MTTKTDLELIQRQLTRADRIQTELLACRVGGDRHHWVQCLPDFTATVGEPLVHQCAACDAIKRVIFAPRSGEILARNYEYPPEYLLHRQDSDREDPLMSAAAVRLSLSKRKRDLQPLRRGEP